MKINYSLVALVLGAWVVLGSSLSAQTTNQDGKSGPEPVKTPHYCVPEDPQVGEVSTPRAVQMAVCNDRYSRDAAECDSDFVTWEDGEPVVSDPTGYTNCLDGALRAFLYCTQVFRTVIAGADG